MSNESITPVLQAINVSKSFGGMCLFDALSISVMPGETLLLSGPNGAGKSTLFNIISGFLYPDAGEIYSNSQKLPLGVPYRIANMGIRRSFQEIRIFPTMTVLDNVLVGGQGGGESLLSGLFRRRSYQEREAKLIQSAREVLDIVGLASRADDKADELSFGQQKLVELSRALVSNPTLLLLDEPIAGVYKELASDIISVLSHLKQSGLAMIIIEHDLDIFADLADDTLLLANGQLTRLTGEPLT